MKNCGAGIIFICKDEILLLEKANKQFWDIPGGKKKSSESYGDAAKRESEEEIGILPKYKKIGFYVHEGKNNKFKVYFAKVDKKFKCRLSDEHTDWKWFQINKLPQNLHIKVAGAIDFLTDALYKNIDKKIQNWFTTF